MLLVLAAVAVALSLVFRPPRSVSRAVVLLAGAMTLMFLLAPSTRFGYFIYPATLAIWLFAVHGGEMAAETAWLRQIPMSLLPARIPLCPPLPLSGQRDDVADGLRVVLPLLGQAEVAQRLHVGHPVRQLHQDRVVGRVLADGSGTPP